MASTSILNRANLGFEVMHERNASSGSVLGINWVALLVRHFTEIPPVCGVCNVTSRDLVGRHHLPTRGSSTFLGSYRIAVGIHLVNRQDHEDHAGFHTDTSLAVSPTLQRNELHAFNAGKHASFTAISVPAWLSLAPIILASDP